jgi:glycosyltransferase involved in cell wall biosynthesis
MMLSDARWIGPHGIGRFAKEVLGRLPVHQQVTRGPKVLSALDPAWLSVQIARRKPHVYFSPGFNPPLFCKAALIFTIHDLIHLRMPGGNGWAKRVYFDRVVFPSAHRAFRILTVSEYSKREIVNWSRLPEERVVVAGNGVDGLFSPHGPRREFGSRYVLYVGNHRPHKNLDRLFAAFRQIADPGLALVMSGSPTEEMRERLTRAGITKRVRFAGPMSDPELAALYRGAELLILPSILEGFGLPVIEAMASGTPVVAARSSSLPEIAGGAAVMVDPLDSADIRRGIEHVLGNADVRRQLREKGLLRASTFTWEKVANRVRRELEAAHEEF